MATVIVAELVAAGVALRVRESPPAPAVTVAGPATVARAAPEPGITPIPRFVPAPRNAAAGSAAPTSAPPAPTEPMPAAPKSAAPKSAAPTATATTPVGSPAVRPTEPPRARPVAPSTVPRDLAVLELLERRGTAVLERNREAWLATVDPQAGAFRQRQAAVFDALVEVPLGSWSYRLVTAGPGVSTTRALTGYRTEAWLPVTQLRYAIKGFDAEPTVENHYLTYVRRGDQWYVGADEDLGSGQLRTTRALWDGGPVEVLRDRSVLVLAHPSSRTLARQILRDTQAAVPVVTDTWGRDWAGKVIVLVPSSQDELERIVGQDADLSQVAAVATAQLAGVKGSLVTVGDRVAINPETFTSLSAAGRRVVLQHEVTHVASRRATGRAAPAWLVEGYADHVGYLGAGISRSTAASELRADLRAGKFPSGLPTDRAFKGSSPDLAQAYEMSWLAVELIADRVGEDGLRRFYRQVGAAGGADSAAAVDAALGDVLDTTLEDFTRDWQRYLRDQLA